MDLHTPERRAFFMRRPAMRVLIGLGAIAILIVGLADVYESTPPSESEPSWREKLIPREQVEPDVRMLIETGLVTRIAFPEVQIDGPLWRTMTVDHKRGAALLLAHYAAHTDGEPYANLIDSRTGKRLADASARTDRVTIR